MSLTNEQRETLREDERHIVESLGHAGANRHGGYHGKPVEHGVNLLAARLCEARAEIIDLRARNQRGIERVQKAVELVNAAERELAVVRRELVQMTEQRNDLSEASQRRAKTMRGWQERAAEIVALSSSSHIHVSTVPSGKALIGPSRISRRKAHDNAAKLARDIAASKQEPDK